MNIPVVFITDENFIMQTGVAIWSLAGSRNKDTSYHVYVVMAECSDGGKKQIMKAERDGVTIKVVEASLERYRDMKQLSHIPIACLLKFNICDLIPEEDKLIYLDGDIIVRGDLTKLYEFDLEDNVIGGVPSLDMIYDDRRLINAGVMLFNAKQMRDEKLSETLIEKRKSLGDRGSMDQQTFNMMLSERTEFLPFCFNCIPNKILGTERNTYPLKKLNVLYHTSYPDKQGMVNDAVILHYATGGKPWRYSYVACGDEWYRCFLSSPYKDVKLKRKSAILAHTEGLVKNLRNGGIKAVAKRAAWYVRSLFGKNKYKSWG